ncbi:MAG: N-acetyltransferase family protein [Candidatus Coatesbacteria bacterium]
MGDLLVRPAGPVDAVAINAIYNHWVLTSTATYQTEPSGLEETRTQLASHGPLHPMIVAVLDGTARGGEVVGWGSLSPFHGREAYARTVENSVYVHPERLRRGIGSALLARLISLGSVAGHRVIVARIDAEQVPSLALHAKHGFTRAGELRQVGYKFDRWLDVIYMQRNLREDGR